MENPGSETPDNLGRGTEDLQARIAEVEKKQQESLSENLNERELALAESKNNQQLLEKVERQIADSEKIRAKAQELGIPVDDSTEAQYQEYLDIKEDLIQKIKSSEQAVDSLSIRPNVVNELEEQAYTEDKEKNVERLEKVLTDIIESRANVTAQTLSQDIGQGIRNRKELEQEREEVSKKEQEREEFIQQLIKTAPSSLMRSWPYEFVGRGDLKQAQDRIEVLRGQTGLFDFKTKSFLNKLKQALPEIVANHHTALNERDNETINFSESRLFSSSRERIKKDLGSLSDKMAEIQASGGSINFDRVAFNYQQVLFKKMDKFPDDKGYASNIRDFVSYFINDIARGK